MARIAIQRRVRPNQRETIHVLIDLLNGDVPALHRVALLAVRAHLPLVNIRVTSGALRSYVGENQLGMALRAAHAFVHAPQRISRGVVIEFRDCSNRLPAAQRVAILAGNAEASVGAPRVRGGIRLPPGHLSAGHHSQRDHQM